MVGQIIKSKNFGLVDVIGKGSKYGYFRVKFRNTEHIDEFRKDALIKGEIRDKYAVTVCGVGIIGDIKTRGKYKKFYSIWHNMICRCYDGLNKAYYKKCIVCDDWKIFENFYSSVKSVKGWNEELFNNGELVLDKDYLQVNTDIKIYSKETCLWVSPVMNNSLQPSQQKEFKAISPDGIIYISNNISEFARTHNLERRSISSVLHKRFKSTFGWKFEYIDKR